MVNTTRKNRAREICKMLTNKGANVLRAKTRKNAMKLMKKIPYTTPTNYNNGMKWWYSAQLWKAINPTKHVNNFIKERSPKVIENCIRNRKIPNSLGLNH